MDYKAVFDLVYSSYGTLLAHEHGDTVIVDLSDVLAVVRLADVDDVIYPVVFPLKKGSTLKDLMEQLDKVLKTLKDDDKSKTTINIEGLRLSCEYSFAMEQCVLLVDASLEAKQDTAQQQEQVESASPSLNQ